MRGLAFIKRRDQGLDDRYCAVIRTRVAPRFQIMRRRNVPVTNLGGFVVVETQMRAQLHFLQPVEIKPEIYGRVVSRITADDDQRIDSAGVDVGYQLAQRLSLID